MRNMLTETRNRYFTERLFYADNLPQSATACYNGNIAALRIDQHGYTKHYFMGNERFCTTIGGGNNGNWLVYPYDNLSQQEQSLLYTLQTDYTYRHFYYDIYDYVHHPSHTNNTDYTGHVQYWDATYEYYQYKADEQYYGNISLEFKQPFWDYFNKYYQNDKKDDPYYYHSDHLGSAAWITDNNGLPTQYIMYAPYGEERINQHPFFYRERFTFTGKERDAETGYDYFGARNYLSALSIWGAVDPLADKYIYNSPYVYCEGNPIIYIDPTGLYGYRNDDGDYQWYPNQVAESFTDETGKQWTLVAKNEKNFTEATTIRQAVVEGLIDSGYEGDAKNDVGLYKESSPLFTKEACFNGDISAFLSWDEKPNSDPTARKSSKAYQSKEIRNSKYAIKFYEEKNGETNAIGIVRTNLSHYIEAGIEWLERKIYGEKATEDPLYDMHYRNAQRLLEHLSSSPK